jgi:hypothetical protein
MRALLVIALLCSPALAEPKPSTAGSATRTEPEARLPDIERPTQDTVNGIIVPAPHPDARPYPRGMVIAPPATGDRMANLTEPWWLSTARSWWQQLSAGIAQLPGSWPSST